jgi:hypothetical protein
MADTTSSLLTAYYILGLHDGGMSPLAISCKLNRESSEITRILQHFSWETRTVQPKRAPTPDAHEIWKNNTKEDSYDADASDSSSLLSEDDWNPQGPGSLL